MTLKNYLVYCLFKNNFKQKFNLLPKCLNYSTLKIRLNASKTKSQLIADAIDRSNEEAESLMRKKKKLSKTDLEQNIEKFKCLQNLFGINSQFIQEYGPLLLMPDDVFKERISVYNKLFPDKDLSTFLHILQMSDEDFNKLKRISYTEGKKISELAELLSCTRGEACQLVLKYKFILRSKLSTLKEKIDLIKVSGIGIEDLKKDLYVLTYTASKLKERIEMIHLMQLSPPKTWMLRCPREALDRTYIIREESKIALAPHPNTASYLSQRLKISPEKVRLFGARHPPVMMVNVIKLKGIFEFLFSEGYSATQIYGVPRVLCHSLATLQVRLQALKDRNYKPFSLSVLCQNKNKFQEFLTKLESSNLKESEEKTEEETSS